MSYFVSPVLFFLLSNPYSETVPLESMIRTLHKMAAPVGSPSNRFKQLFGDTTQYEDLASDWNPGGVPEPNGTINEVAPPDKD